MTRTGVDGTRLRRLASVLLVVGAALGMAGSFAPSAALRGLAWGVDGVSLIVASVCLCIWHLRQGDQLLASGFLVFAIGEGLIVSSSAMTLEASAPSFGAGCGLWGASLAMISASRVLPMPVRLLGWVTAALFWIVALQIFSGAQLTPLSAPLPFFAYPFFAATLIGWAWVHLRGGKPIGPD